MKAWLVRPANESDCAATDCGSHVKRVLTRSDGTDLDTGFFPFLERARRDVEGEGKSCRPSPQHLARAPPC